MDPRGINVHSVFNSNPFDPSPALKEDDWKDSSYRVRDFDFDEYNKKIDNIVECFTIKIDELRNAQLGENKGQTYPRNNAHDKAKDELETLSSQVKEELDFTDSVPRNRLEKHTLEEVENKITNLNKLLKRIENCQTGLTRRFQEVFHYNPTGKVRRDCNFL